MAAEVPTQPTLLSLKKSSFEAVVSSMLYPAAACTLSSSKTSLTFRSTGYCSQKRSHHFDDLHALEGLDEELVCIRVLPKAGIDARV